MRTKAALVLTLALGGWSCNATDVGGPLSDSNATGGIAESGGGNPFDQQNPGEVGPDLSKADGNAYVVPTLLPPLADPRIVVSLAGFTVELIDEATGFHKVYPTGVGALGSSGRSYTPVGEFKTHADPDNSWFWYARRYQPSYFEGFPFMRIDATNSRGYNTYGFHGPITNPLQRGYVSHGCMRMQGPDIVELFYMMREHPGAKVSIQQEKRYLEDGTLVDVTPTALDPVAAYRETVCAEQDGGAGELIEAGSLADRVLCDGEAAFKVAVEQGDRVEVTVTASGPFALKLTAGDADDSAESEVEDRQHAATASLRVAEAGEITVRVLGDVATYDLRVVHVPFGTEIVDGWVGDGCASAAQCGDLECLADLPGGLCTEACERFCPDRDGAAGTFCVDLGFSDGGRCVATCEVAEDCREGYACLAMERFNEPGTEKSVCVPTR